jgi:ribosomal protein S18 acetylase RimI-like enzyme
MKTNVGTEGIAFGTGERLAFPEYFDFLRRTDLGRQYPKARFQERVSRLLATANVVVTARDDERLVGVCLGLTDFAYYLQVTDLGVDTGYQRRGIGRRLLTLAHEAAGGEDDITLLLMANSRAVAFYESCGLSRFEDILGKEARVWERFDVCELPE